MDYETALFLKLLLHAGMTETYYESLNALLEETPVLEGILLELSYEPNDTQEAISLLNDFLSGQKVDHDAVAEKLRSVLFDRYNEGKMNQSEVVCALYAMAENSGHETAEPWYSMLMMEEYYCLAVQGDTDADRFNGAFFDFLSDQTLFSESYSQPKGELHRIAHRRREDKLTMTRSGFFLNHVAPYIYLTLFLAVFSLVGAMIDASAAVFRPQILILLGGFVLITTLYFAAGPLIRIHRLPIELKKLNLETTPENRRDRYEFTHGLEPIAIDQAGVTAGDDFFRFEHLTAEFDTTGKFYPVELHIMFRSRFGQTILIPLSPDALAMLERFHIKLENQAHLDYLLQNPRQAMRDILKYGVVWPERHKPR